MQKTKALNESELINNYFNLELFDLIKEVLYIMPLWCGILIKDIQDTINRDLYPMTQDFFEKTRLDNNNGECNFKILKHNLLQGNKNNSCSVVTLSLYSDLNSKFQKYYKNKLEENEMNETEKFEYDDNMKNLKEFWCKFFQKKKNQSSSYYDMFITKEDILEPNLKQINNKKNKLGRLL